MVDQEPTGTDKNDTRRENFQKFLENIPTRSGNERIFVTSDPPFTISHDQEKGIVERKYYVPEESTSYITGDKLELARDLRNRARPSHASFTRFGPIHTGEHDQPWNIYRKQEVLNIFIWPPQEHHPPNIGLSSEDQRYGMSLRYVDNHISELIAKIYEDDTRLKFQQRITLHSNELIDLEHEGIPKEDTLWLSQLSPKAHTEIEHEDGIITITIDGEKEKIVIAVPVEIDSERVAKKLDIEDLFEDELLPDMTLDRRWRQTSLTSLLGAKMDVIDKNPEKYPEITRRIFHGEEPEDEQ